MCGITGKICFGKNQVSIPEIERMNMALVHRGPDAHGVYISTDKQIGLGHQRLSIIDLSSQGRQPMSYLGRYWITFNGEIYNFAEEREKLVQLGYCFVSRTDTEVILALYDKYHEQCLDHLRGMFSFAIYDEQDKVLFCARDRVGKKPFKYYQDGRVFIFASELKSILTQPEYRRQPDLLAIHHYLTYQYCPAPLTGFTGIKKLPPGHYLKLNVHSGEVQIRPYWQLTYRPQYNLTEADWQKRILSKLDEAVRLRMISDVPLGAFLSGGVDSSAIVALMSQASSQPVKTFSIGFAEDRFNELPYARQVSELYKTDHTEFIVKPAAMDILPELVHQYEEPYADSSAIPTYYLSKLTRQHVTVALNGDGGDENFAGYSRYNFQKLALLFDQLRIMPAIATLNPLVKLLEQIVPTTLLHRARRFSETAGQGYRHRYVNYICYFSNQMKKDLYTDYFYDATAQNDSYDIVAKAFLGAVGVNRMDQALFADIATYLPEDLLVKVDIASMAVALECRSPFLDHEFMELAAQIPFNLKLRGYRTNKYILKKSLSSLLPDNILYRPKKGFMVPIEAWFRGDMRQYLASMLLSKRTIITRELCKKSSIEVLLHTHATTEINLAPPLWALLTLELWFRDYFS